MTTAMQIANWMFARAAASGVRNMSNMKLNKMLYFAQAHHLAATGTALFDDDVEAWDHGPVVYDVYSRFSRFKSDPIQMDDVPAAPELGEVAEDVLSQVWAIYADKTASQLRAMSHDDPPYVDHYTGTHRTVMPVKEIRDYYHRGAPAGEHVISAHVDYVDEQDVAALDRASTPEAVAKAVAYLLA
ncbi:Panacea domain-containing protein [Cellulomonas sp. NPDC058312]|uniref:Panacea domain-containing protein n=1 Tax=Cellulomonas sp. NPDC058312 TaxID=3346441 RepID=UPI0036EC9D75